MSQGKRRTVAVDHSAWAEAAALLLLPAVVAAVQRMLGGPTWLTLCYLGLGVVLAASRVAYEWRRGEPAEPDPAAAPGELVADSDVIRAFAAEHGVTLPSISHDAATPADAAERYLAARPRERRAVGYVHVTGDGGRSELAAHSEVIRAWAAENDVTLTSIMHDVEAQTAHSGARPALRGALERIARREADTLVTARLVHLSPTVANLPPLLRWLSGSSRTLVAIDLRLDSATEAGRLAAAALADIGGWEHDRLSARTRRGLQAARARGSGAGPASVADQPELKERIERMREQGMTLQAIADALNEAGVPTLRGGAKWRPSSVQRATGYRRPRSQLPNIDLPGWSPQGEDEPAPPS